MKRFDIPRQGGKAFTHRGRCRPPARFRQRDRRCPKVIAASERLSSGGGSSWPWAGGLWGPDTMNDATRSKRSLLAISGLLLIASLFFPYWLVELEYPADPAPLEMKAYVGHLEGPLLERAEQALAAAGAEDLEAARLESSGAAAAALAFLFLVLAATFAGRRWSLLLWLPAVAFPAVLLLDAASWLSAAAAALTGHPGLPLETPLLAWGRLGIDGLVFTTRPGSGAFLALGSSLLLVGGALYEVLSKGK